MSIPRNLGNFADNVNANGKVEVTGINATGTPSASTVLYGDGTWAAAGGGGSPAGSNTQIQYNNSGAFGASANLTFDGNTLSSSTATASGISLNTSTAGKANIAFKSAGTQKAIVGLSGAILGTTATDIAVFAETGSAIKLYANGAVTNSGTFNQYGFGIGAAVPSSGQGITFPAAQDASSNANTLDDYEEGTWTPALAFGGGSTGLTYSNQVGNYTKIGNRVFISGYVNIANKGSSTGNLTITGLPFTSSSTSFMYNSMSIAAFNLTSISGSLQAYNAPNTSTVSEITYLGTGSHTAVTQANCITSSGFMINFSYSI